MDYSQKEHKQMKYLQRARPKNFVHLLASPDFVAMAMVDVVAVEQIAADLAVEVAVAAERKFFNKLSFILAICFCVM